MFRDLISLLTGRTLGLAAQMKELRERVARLEEVNVSEEKLAEALKQLGRKVVGAHPNMNYFNERFRDYELALGNIKQLGYHLSRQLYDANAARHFTGPNIFPLTSKACTQKDMESEWFGFWCSEIRSSPCYYRKLWEFCYIAQALYNEGKLEPGAYGLGFGCGEEPLPSLFAKYGAKVLATDLNKDRPETKGWRASNEHIATAEEVRRRDVCADEQKLINIDFRPLDMNEIPADLHARFDFCWSACALEHLGSIEKGLAFVENSLRCLKPRGIAVHTTELNTSDGETIDNWGTVLYQRRHLEEFAARLRSSGYRVADFDFDIGSGVMDKFVDTPPWLPDRARQYAHLKLSIDGFICTSFGLIVQAPG